MIIEALHRFILTTVRYNTFVKDVDSIVFDGMAIIQVSPVHTSAAKRAYDDIASLFWKHDFLY